MLDVVKIRFSLFFPPEWIFRFAQKKPPYLSCLHVLVWNQVIRFIRRPPSVSFLLAIRSLHGRKSERHEFKPKVSKICLKTLLGQVILRTSIICFFASGHDESPSPPCLAYGYMDILQVMINPVG